VDAETVRATLERRLGPLIESITDLDDEQRARLRGWSNARLAELATTARRHPEREAGSQLERAAGQLVGLLEAISLALSGWDARQPGMALGRLELLDTYLEPPLLVGQRLDVARGRVAVLLEDLRDQMDQVAPKSEIARRLLEALD
jgi:hypothetical protein